MRRAVVVAAVVALAGCATSGPSIEERVSDQLGEAVTCEHVGRAPDPASGETADASKCWLVSDGTPAGCWAVVDDTLAVVTADPRVPLTDARSDCLPIGALP